MVDYTQHIWIFYETQRLILINSNMQSLDHFIYNSIGGSSLHSVLLYMRCSSAGRILNGVVQHFRGVLRGE